MIDINFYKNGFVVTGHANFDSKGKDIVCSAVSGIFFGFLNWLKEKDYKKIEDNKIPLLKVSLTLNNEIEIGFNLLKVQIMSIYKAYKKQINLNINNSNLDN